MSGKRCSLSQALLLGFQSAFVARVCVREKKESGFCDYIKFLDT